MKYSPSIEVIMSLAVNEAVAAEFSEIHPEHLFTGLLKFSELDAGLLKNILNLGQAMDFLKTELSEMKQKLAEHGIDSTEARRQVRKSLGRGDRAISGPVLHRSRETRRLFSMAEEAARSLQIEWVSPVLLLQAVLTRPTPLIGGIIGSKSPAEAAPDERKPAEFLSGPDDDRPDLGSLTQALKGLRTDLLDKIFGQDHAVHAFVEGLFNAEVVAAADTGRVRPKALFVFAGPPGVGKTYLAESGAQALDRPFRRFDMSGYSDATGVILLTGAQRSFQGAKTGQLTGFVSKNPDAVLLFDEIEKADINVIHLFLQLLDNGTLEDKYTETNVAFKDTIVIFTTNAGRTLYDDPNAAGVSAVKPSFHRKTILGALERETDSRTGRPFFPQAICSRMATGYPIMFNRLGVTELEKIAEKELERTGGLLEKQYGKTVTFGPAVPLCLVMREGARTDARTVRAQAETFVKTEMFKFFSLYRPERLTEIMSQSRKIIFDLDSTEEPAEEIKALLEPRQRSKVLLALRPSMFPVWPDDLPDIDVKPAVDLPEAQNLLAMHDFDFVLLDLWFDNPYRADEAPGSNMETAYVFDHVPVAARSVHGGQELLRHLRERHPETPCYLLSFPKPGGAAEVDEELLYASIRSGGARGVVKTVLPHSAGDDEEAVEKLAEELSGIARRIYRSRQADELGSQSKALSFDTAPTVSTKNGDICVRLRNLRTMQAVAAEDVSEVISEAERPATKFEDVYGADQAKSELEYIVKWLKNPKHYKKLDLKPPRGILFYGAPGTGKTMLARALAGECDVTFIVESATNFVTKWVGSGPENIRNIFARARRYAPSILFIDEIDAIGRKRSGESHNRAQEETLNALLTEMDGFGAPTARPVIVLAATNLVESLDDALVRRFDREIEVDKPDRAARYAYLQKRLQGGTTRRVSDQVLDRLAGQSANMTIAQLERVVQFAGRKAALSDSVITDELIEEAFETMRMGEAKSATDPETLLRVARHEAGHCLIGWLNGEKPVQITIVARGKAGGYVEREADEDRMIYTRPELEGRIRQAMGGRAAEILYYGQNDGLSTGVSGDLRQSTHYAEMMVREYGMGPNLGQVAIDQKRLHDGPLAIKVMEEVQGIVREQLDRAVEILTTHRGTLDRLVEALMEKNRLTGSELDAVLKDLDQGSNQD